MDIQAGPAAVIRNLNALIPSVDLHWRVVVTDRFYTSVQLALQLLNRQVYVVGTIMTNRRGYCKDVIDKRKKRPDTAQRGSMKIAVSNEFPMMKALSSMDKKPVHFLSTFESRSTTTIGTQMCIVCTLAPV